MRITYEWTEREWAQAVGVATRKSARGAPLPGMIYALIGIPLLGAVGDLISLVRQPGRGTLAGSIVPLVLVMFAATVAVIGVARTRQRHRREGFSPMPDGVREMVLQEAGWRFNALEQQRNDRSVATSASASPVSVPVNASTLEVASQLRSWSELVEARQGSGVIVLVHRDGFEAVPSKSLTPEQAGHLHRLVMRKMRPAM